MAASDQSGMSSLLYFYMEADAARYRLRLFRTRLASLFATRLQDPEQFLFTDLLPMINEGLSTDILFGTAEATAACQVMTEANEIMLSGDVVYKI